MGCWKETIYGGDTPLEYKEKIYDLCGVEEYGSDNKSKPIPAKIINKKLAEIKSMIDDADEDDDINIGYLVLGAIIMHAGAKFDESTMNRVVRAADEDEWSKENQLRKIVIKNYQKTLKEYNHKNPIDIESLNTLEEVEDTEEDIISNEFKSLFTIINARINKLRNSIQEKEYDEGYGDAYQEEIDFLTDFKEMIEKQEQLAIIFERIENEINTSSFSIVEQKFSNNHSFGSGSMNGGNDIIIG